MSNHEEALVWVNKYRAERGLPLLDDLPRGMPMEERQCPLALAIEGQMQTELARFETHEEALDAARAWGTFIEHTSPSKYFWASAIKDDEPDDWEGYGRYLIGLTEVYVPKAMRDFVETFDNAAKDSEIRINYEWQPEEV